MRGLKRPANPSKETPHRAGPSTVMYVEDRGAVYDAPLEVVWDFMNDEVFHPRAHTADVRNFKEKPLSEVSTLLSYERRKAGRWEKMVCRLTTIRPAVRIQEDLNGPYAGATTVFLYTSQGKRTVVDVFGYGPTSGMTLAEFRTGRKKMWARAYSEDLPYFRRFAEEHPSGGTTRK